MIIFIYARASFKNILLKGILRKMSKKISIQKNASCHFPIFLEKNAEHLTDFITSYQNEKEIIFLGNPDKIPDFLMAELSDLEPNFYNLEEHKLTELLVNAITKNQFVVWFPYKDHETTLDLSGLSLKGLDYVLIPVTPIAQITCEYIYDIWNKKGVEYYAKGIYSLITLWKEADTESLLAGYASVLRFGIQENAAFYEWILSNMYEAFEKEEDFLISMLEKKAAILQKKLDNKTVAQRCIPHFGSMFEYCLSSSCKELHESDVISMSCLMHAYLAWSKKILSMEEYFEIRDMFVAFDMGISETSAKAEVLLTKMREDNTRYAYSNFKEFPYLSKIGKLITDNTPTEKDLLDAAMAVYFDEEALD